MRKIRLLALVLAMVMVVAVFASCGPKDEGGDETPEAPMTFATFINPSSPTLEDVVTKMEAVADLDGYTRLSDGDEFSPEYYDAGSEFRFFVKNNAETGFNSYKVFSLRNAKVVATFNDTADVTNHLGILDEETPTFYVYKSEKVWLNPEHTDHDLRSVRVLYDANGTAILSKINDGLDTPSVFYNWVIINRDIYTVDRATGAFTKKTTIPRNIGILDADDAMLVNNNIYVETSSGVAVYDTDFNYIGEWFTPVNVSDYRHFVLNDGNVLIQYSKRLVPDAVEYDYYEGNNANTMVKYDLVTEIFSIADQTVKNVDCASYIQSLISNNYIRTMLTVYGKDASEFVGDFENLAITYPIQEKKLNMKNNVLDFVLTDNNAVLGKSIKLVANQTGMPEKFAENLYKVATTYGEVLTDVEGKIVKQITSEDISKVGEYLYDDDGIYNLNYELVYDFGEKNAEVIGSIHNTIFVRQYSDADKNGDYSVLAFSKGEPKEICKYVKANANNVIFDLNTELNVYSLYNQETKLYSYYNADGTVLLKDFANNIGLYDSYKGCLAWYNDTSSGTPVVKYIAISGNFFENF